MTIHAFIRSLIVSAVVLGIFSPGTPVRAAATRTVTASATCDRSAGGLPTVQVTVTNNSLLLIHVAYAVSYSGPEAISARGLEGLLQTETPEQQIVDIENGESATLDAPWAGREERDGEAVSAIVITSAGLLLPTCGARPSHIENPNPQPVVAGEEGMESATAMAKTIGSLESLKAYPALYALLHPDVRKLVPFEAVACFYAAQYGPPLTETTKLVYSTDVTDVSFVSWTWPVNGTAYERVAEVTYTQKIGVFPHSDVIGPMVEHLVRVDGVWRWFFGTDAAALSDLPTECGLPAYT